MDRKVIFASHHRLADGLADTVQFITGDDNQDKIVVLSAYLDNEPVEKSVEKLMNQFSSDTELVILTDMMAGSVNQKFFSYRTRPHTHIISGMNLPLALAFVLEPQSDYLTDQRVREMVQEAQTAIVNMNDVQVGDDDDDE